MHSLAKTLKLVMISSLFVLLMLAAALYFTDTFSQTLSLLSRH
ncbi:hypothetical protein [Dongshaea marina]|nr:hypothetical protein [Dongshaea marina]